MVERTPGRRIILILVENRSKSTLESLLSKYVDSQSTINSDCWCAYNILSVLFEEHNTVNHSLFFKDLNTLVHTNTIEANWFAVKDQVSPRHGTKFGVGAYLMRYMSIRNHKDDVFKIVLNFHLS